MLNLPEILVLMLSKCKLVKLFLGDPRRTPKPTISFKASGTCNSAPKMDENHQNNLNFVQKLVKHRLAWHMKKMV